MTGETQILMTCPQCSSNFFKIYFQGDATLVPPRGSVWAVCTVCGSYWTGSMDLEEGFLKPFVRKEAHGKS